MARISTYPIDSSIHMNDNVIGTNQSDGHQSETVLFPVSTLARFIRNGYARIFDAEVSFGQDIPANGFLPAAYLPSAGNPGPNGYPTTIASPAQEAVFTYQHDLNTRNVIVSVFENVMEYTFTDTNTQSPQGTNSYVAQGYQDVSEDVDIFIIDENNIRVDFGLPRPITGNVIIIG